MYVCSSLKIRGGGVPYWYIHACTNHCKDVVLLESFIYNVIYFNSIPLLVLTWEITYTVVTSYFNRSLEKKLATFFKISLYIHFVR